MTSPEKIWTAGLIVIGDEILSGRTRDSNMHHLAKRLTDHGITLAEARVVADDHAAIVAAVNALRAAYTHVFTSGGIGPTHDDITADAIAAVSAREREPETLRTAAGLSPRTGLE
jgi:molybdenum cofactor synthesis domain-containing protein